MARAIRYRRSSSNGETGRTPIWLCHGVHAFNPRHSCRQVVLLEGRRHLPVQRHHPVVDRSAHVVENREPGVLLHLAGHIVQDLQVLPLLGLARRGCDENRESQRCEHQLLQHLLSSCRHRAGRADPAFRGKGCTSRPEQPAFFGLGTPFVRSRAVDLPTGRWRRTGGQQRGDLRRRRPDASWARLTGRISGQCAGGGSPGVKPDAV